MHLATLFICISLLALTTAQKEIFDPFFVFCGTRNCYDVLGVQRSDDIATISKAYRTLSRTVHPDKVHPDKRVNVTEEFRLIAKAYEVLKGNESRPNFDFYLDHPRQYFKATGKHAWRALPKVHPLIVSLFALFIVSGVVYYLQISKHRRAVSMLKEQIKAGLALNKGGNKLALDLHAKAVKHYENFCKVSGNKFLGNPFSSPAVKEKMQSDPAFDASCIAVMTDIKDWGDYSLPTVNDLFIVKFFTVWPFSFVAWARTYYRRYHSGLPLSAEDQEDMARSILGVSEWEDLTPAERKLAIEKKVWESAAYDAWLASRDGVASLSRRQQKLQKKMAKYGQGGEQQARDLNE
jgi:hypothetical protein